MLFLNFQFRERWTNVLLDTFRAQNVTLRRKSWPCKAHNRVLKKIRKFMTPTPKKQFFTPTLAEAFSVKGGNSPKISKNIPAQKMRKIEFERLTFSVWWLGS